MNSQTPDTAERYALAMPEILIVLTSINQSISHIHLRFKEYKCNKNC